jgi:PAS domain S-box-containing protein
MYYIYRMGKLSILLIIAISYLSYHTKAQTSSFDQSDEIIAGLDKKGWALRKIFPDSTIYYADLIIDQLRSNGDTSRISKYYNYKGIGFHYKGDNYTSYSYYLLAYETSQKLGDSIQFAHSMNNLGRFFHSQGNYVKAFDFSKRALEVFTSLNNNDGEAFSLKRISEVYASQGYLDRALQAAKKALQIRINYFDINTQATAHSDLADMYLIADSLEEAQKHYLVAINKANEGLNSVLIATGQIGLSELHIKLNNYDSAIFYAQAAKSLALQIDNEDLLNRTFVQSGKAYYNSKKLVNAKKEFDLILQRVASSNQLQFERDAFYYLARINASLGQGMKAFEYQLKFDGLENQLNNIKDKRAIDSLLFRQEIALQAKENDLLLLNNQKDKELLESQKWQNQLMIVAIVSILVALAVFYRNTKRTKASNELLLKRNKEIYAQKEEISANLEEKQILENELLGLNQRLQAILNSGFVSIISTTTEGLITHFSKGAENLLGYESAEMVGKQTPAIIHDPDEVIIRGKELSKKYGKEIGGFQVFVTEADNKGFESREWTYIKKDGTHFPVQLVVSVLKGSHGSVAGYLGIAIDISEQKHIEEQLRLIVNENEHYKDILENVEDIIYELNGDGTYSYANPATCRLSGYSRDELMTMHYLDLISNSRKESVNEFYLSQYNSKTENTSHEFIIKNKSGKEIWIRQTTTMFFDHNGNLKRILAVAQNINEIHELRTQLDSQFELYKLVSENSQDLIALHDLEGKYLYVSPSIKSLLGYNPESLVGKNPYDFIHPDEHNKLKDGPHSNTINGRMENNIEYRLRSKSGKYKWFEAYTSPVYDKNNRVISFQTSSRDITERKIEQEKINRYQKGLRLINNLSATSSDNIDKILEKSLEFVSEYLKLPLGIISAIKKGKYQVRNYFSKDPTGLKKGQVFDFKNTYCDLTYRNDGVTSISLMSKSSYSGHPCYKSFEIESYIGAIVYVNEKKYGTVNFSSVNPRKEKFDELDEDFIVLYANWVGSIIQRHLANESLLVAKEKAELASKAKADFLSIMSHEIRTPLNGILGLTNILLQEKPRKDQIANLNLLKFSGDNLLVIINDILDFNKIEAGKINLENTDFNLYELLESIQQTNTFKIREKDINLELNYDHDLPLVFVGDPVRLGQVINNLVSNAIKFTDKGSITIDCILLRKNESKALLKIKIRDTGKGIDETKFDKIFERFSQEEESTTRVYGGTGLGLPITKNLLGLMGSDIKVESELGIGSTFSFDLELLLGDPLLLKDTDPSMLKLTELGELNLKILVADDNDLNYKIAANFLGRWKVKSDHAEDGRKAVDMALKKDYDLILMDLQMPNMDGYKAASKILKVKPKQSIIALTASVLEEVKTKAKNHGMIDFLSKPMTPHHLYEKIVKILNLTPVDEFTPLLGSAEPKPPHIDNLKGSLEKISMGSLPFSIELIGLYIDNLNELRSILKHSIQSKNEEQARQIIHKMSTTIRTLQLEGLNSMCQTIIDKISSNKIEIDDYNKVKLEIDHLIKNLTEIKSEWAKSV